MSASYEKMSSYGKTTIIIIDALSYRGSDDEQVKAGVREIIIRNKDKLAIQSKHQELIYGIVIKLLELKDSSIEIILYLQSHSRSYYDVVNLVNDKFSEYKIDAENKSIKEDWWKIRPLVGLESLFYYLGTKSSQIK